MAPVLRPGHGAAQAAADEQHRRRAPGPDVLLTDGPRLPPRTREAAPPRTRRTGAVDWGQPPICTTRPNGTSVTDPVTDAQVRELRRRAKKGEPDREVAVRFNIHITCVQDIIAGRTRKSA